MLNCANSLGSSEQFVVKRNREILQLLIVEMRFVILWVLLVGCFPTLYVYWVDRKIVAFYELLYLMVVGGYRGSYR